MKANPSKKSRKSSKIRRKNRKFRLLKNFKDKEVEVSDLQTQLVDLERLVQYEGQKVLDEINKCSRENENLVKWLNVYDKQIKDHEKEIYNLNLKLYFSSSSSSSSSSLSSSSSSLSSPQQPQQPQQPQ